MTMHADLALSSVEQIPEDRCCFLVVRDRIGEQVGRHDMIVIQDGLERRNLLNVRDAGGAGGGQPPLIFLRVNGNDEFHQSPQDNLDRLPGALDQLEEQGPAAAVVRAYRERASYVVGPSAFVVRVTMQEVEETKPFLDRLFKPTAQNKHPGAGVRCRGGIE
jgi:hypothetical protein